MAMPPATGGPRGEEGLPASGSASPVHVALANGDEAENDDQQRDERQFERLGFGSRCSVHASIMTCFANRAITAPLGEDNRANGGHERPPRPGGPDR